MNITALFVLIWIVVYIMLIFVGSIFSNPDSGFNKRKFDKKAYEIAYSCRLLNSENVIIENKGCIFTIKVEDEKRGKSISSSNPYSSVNIYINDELVCKIHKLENGLFSTYRQIEYASQRSGKEIYNIIMKAYKISKSNLKERYKNACCINDNNIISFYNNKTKEL